jgi:hypothetical protein
VAIDDFSFAPNELEFRLQGFFDQAKSVDEFEFACSLLRVRGMESPGWDPLGETQQLVEDIVSLIAAPLVGYTQARLGLLLYSHLTEVGAMYDVFANLARVVRGERYVIDPFLEHYPRNRKGEALFLSTPGKVRALNAMLDDIGRTDVAETISWFFQPSVRNAFAHADYTLHDDRFRSRSESFEVGGVRSPELSMAVLTDVVNRGLAFYGAFVHEYSQQLRSYSANRIVHGRIGGGDRREPVELLGDPQRGLHGFRGAPSA